MQEGKLLLFLLGDRILSSMESGTVIFLKAADNQSKISCICDTVRRCFEEGKAVLIAVSSQEASNFLDNLLWRYPEDSFLPHVVSNDPVSDRIVITMNEKNINNAAVLFNLRPNANLSRGMFQVIYDLFDETHPDKLKLSQQRLQAYRDAGCNVQ